MKVLGYVRVSTQEQHTEGVGIDVQRAHIAQECERRGWELSEILEDPGYSAKDLNRPGMQAALSVMGDYDVLMVGKLDRLSRSLLDFSSIMERARIEGWAMVALDLNVDTTTPAGEMMANVLATFAQFERRLISQRTKEGLAIKKAQGVKLGRRYQVPIELRREIWKRRDMGETFASIAHSLTERGEPTARGGIWRGNTILAICLDREQAEAEAPRSAGDLRSLPTQEPMGAGALEGQTGPVD